MGKLKKANSKIKIRRRWKINPKTRIKESAKRYRRSRERKIAGKTIKNASEKST